MCGFAHWAQHSGVECSAQWLAHRDNHFLVRRPEDSGITVRNLVTTRFPLTDSAFAFYVRPARAFHQGLYSTRALGVNTGSGTAYAELFSVVGSQSASPLERAQYAELFSVWIDPLRSIHWSGSHWSTRTIGALVHWDPNPIGKVVPLERASQWSISPNGAIGAMGNGLQWGEW